MNHHSQSVRSSCRAVNPRVRRDCATGAGSAGMARVTSEHTEARRRSILQAAHTVFARTGMQAATMAEIAAEAGLSPGILYRYFDNKDALALSCFNQTSEQLAQEWHQLGAESAD